MPAFRILKEEALFPPVVGIAYDASGNVSSVTETPTSGSSVVTTYTYTTDGAVDTDTRAGVTRQYTYDTSGNLTGIEVV